MSKTADPDKSYVGMQCEVCPACAKEKPVGILFNTRLKDTLPRETVTGMMREVCEDCKKMTEGGTRIILVAIDEEKSKDAFLKNGNLAPSKVWRTGAVMYMRKSAWDSMINVPCPEGDVCFFPQEAFDMMVKMGQECGVEGAVIDLDEEDTHGKEESSEEDSGRDEASGEAKNGDH